MRCDELLRMINEYVDGTLEPGLCRDLEGHLSGCDPCTVVIDNIRQTITLYNGEVAVELPAGFRERARAALRRRWAERAGGAMGSLLEPGPGGSPPAGDGGV